MFIRHRKHTPVTVLIILAVLTLTTGGVISYHMRTDLNIHDSHHDFSVALSSLRSAIVLDYLQSSHQDAEFGDGSSSALQVFDREFQQTICSLTTTHVVDGNSHAQTINSLLPELRERLQNHSSLQQQPAAEAINPDRASSAKMRLDASFVETLGFLEKIGQESEHLLDDRRDSIEQSLVVFALLGFLFFGLLTWQLLRRLRRQGQEYYQIASSEQRLRALLENSPDRILLLNPAGDICFANHTSLTGENPARTGANVAILVVGEYRDAFSEAISTTISANEVRELTGVQMSDGLICNIRLIPLSGSANAIQVMAVITDVTEGCRARQELKKSEQKYRSLFHNAQAGLVRFSIDTGVVTECNSNFAEMLGFSGPEACIGHFCLDEFYSDETVRDYVSRELKQSGEVSNVTIEYKLPKGQLAWLNFSARSYVEEGFTEGVLVDLTRQRQAERGLIESTERYRLIFEESPTSLWEEDLSRVKQYCDALKESGVTDLNDYFASNPDKLEECLGMIEILRVNSATRELLGTDTPKDFLSLHSKYMDEGTIAGMGNALLNLVSGSTRLSSEGVFFNAAGEHIDVIVDIRVPEQHRNTLARVIIAVTDVSEQRRAERELRDSRTRLDLALRSVRDGLWEFFIETGRMSFDEHCAEIQGLQHDQLPRTFDDWQDMIHPADRPLVLAALGDHLAGVDNQFCCEYRVKQASGDWIWILDRGSIASPGDGETAPKIIGTRSDIQSRKYAEIAQRESEQKWRTIAENSSDYIAVTDRVGNIQYINRVPPPSGRRDVEGHNISKFIVPEHREAVLTAIATAYETGRTVSVDLVGEMPDGQYRQLRARIGRLEPHSDREACTLSITDVSEQHQMTQALLESEERFDLAVRGSHDGLWDWYNVDNDNDMWWSPQLYKMLGREPNAHRPSMNAFLEDIHEEDARKIRVAVERHMVDRMPLDIDFRMRVKHGEYRWFRMRGQALWDNTGKALRLAGSIRDETDRRLAEQALRDSEATLMSILTAAPTGIGIVSNRIIKWASDELLNMLGYVRDEMIGRSARFLYTSKEEFQRVGDVKYKLMSEHGVGEVETQWIRKDGSVIDIVLRSSPIDPNDPSAGVSFTALDITAMKRTQKALVDSEAKVKELFDSMPDGMLLTGPEGTIYDANPALVEMLDYGPDGLVQQNLYRLSTFQWHEMIATSIEKVCKRGWAELEIELTHMEGHQIPVSISLWRMANDGSQPDRIGGVVRDISLRRKMEEELIKREKLESVGQLAGGIAHDFNNLLTAILGNISLARLDCGDTEVALQLDDAERAAERARSLTQQLLTFAKGGDPIRKATSIVDLVRESASFVIRGSSNRLVFDFESGIGPISIDEGQITQVIYNLVINADQATSDGGVIRIRVCREKLEENQIPDSEPGDYVCLSVSDEGVGIPRENLSKIFDPFYTTKRSGSGLGLATTYSIVKKHGGIITVDSIVNIGTTFRVYLRATPSSTDLTPLSSGDFQSGQGRILLMDDEEVIRQVAGRALTKAGYSVEFALDGMDAVSKYKTAKLDGKPFDVVILDLTIPGGMGGKDTIAALRAFDPEVKAIVSSGYSNDPVSSTFLEFGFADAVHKPYKPQHLLEIVRRVIGIEYETKSAQSPSQGEA